ncbi:hypothetical protein M1397_00695 [Candidatus Marsarchaeota archaeon]|nr:hypothetical protein [Candidatus Marsarchaeota archaeon]
MLQVSIMSIGAIYALIPLVVIIILIAAAVGLTRGTDIFALFGLGAIMGIGGGVGGGRTGNAIRGGSIQGYGGDPKNYISYGKSAAAVPTKSLKDSTKARTAERKLNKQAKKLTNTVVAGRAKDLYNSAESKISAAMRSGAINENALSRPLTADAMQGIAAAANLTKSERVVYEAAVAAMATRTAVETLPPKARGTVHMSVSGVRPKTTGTILAPTKVTVTGRTGPVTVPVGAGTKNSAVRLKTITETERNLRHRLYKESDERSKIAYRMAQNKEASGIELSQNEKLALNAGWQKFRDAGRAKADAQYKAVQDKLATGKKLTDEEKKFTPQSATVFAATAPGIGAAALGYDIATTAMSRFPTSGRLGAPAEEGSQWAARMRQYALDKKERRIDSSIAAQNEGVDKAGQRQVDAFNANFLAEIKKRDRSVYNEIAGSKERQLQEAREFMKYRAEAIKAEEQQAKEDQVTTPRYKHQYTYQDYIKTKKKEKNSSNTPAPPSPHS